MQSRTRPSPRLTLPQNLLISAAQAPWTASIAEATRSLRSDWADRLEGAQSAAKSAAGAIMVLEIVAIRHLLRSRLVGAFMREGHRQCGRRTLPSRRKDIGHELAAAAPAAKSGVAPISRSATADGRQTALAAHSGGNGHLRSPHLAHLLRCFLLWC